MKAKSLQHILGNAIAVTVSLVTCLPVYLVIVNALKNRAQASSMGMGLPTELHWENFATVVERGKLAQSFVNSMLYSGISTVLGVLLAAMAAYVLARNRTRINRLLYLLIIMGIAVPINFFTLTKVMQFTQLINTRPGIIMLYAAGQIPFSVFLIYNFVGTIPRELDEAAIIDGCGPIRLFFSVILPLLTPVIVTAAVLNILSTWNEFILPLYYLNSSTKWPMTLAVYNFFGQYQSDWSLVSADILLTILPVIIIYLLGQRFILSGMTSGAVKG